MKRSLILTLVLCLLLGESFSVISKKEKSQKKTPVYACSSSCKKQGNKQFKGNNEPQVVVPMVNILGYN